MGAQGEEDASTDSSPSGTLVNTPTEAFSPASVQDQSGEDREAISGREGTEKEECRTTDLSPGAQKSGHSTPLDEARDTLQDVGETIRAAEARLRAQEELLWAEVAAHQQTCEDFARLEDWCKRLEDENMRLQKNADDAGRENARIGRQLHITEDKLTRFQIHADNQVRGYMNSIKKLQEQVVGLNAGIAWYIQLGINFHGRLQKAEKLLKPYERVFVQYKHLMSDAAQYFSTPINAGNQKGGIPDDIIRVEEIHGDDHDMEEGNDRANGSISMLDIDEVTCDHTSANEAGATITKEDITAINDEDDDDDDDDNYPRFGRPMRPGTANRVPISVFAARSRNTPKNPPSSLSENPCQQTRSNSSPQTPTFRTGFDFSKPSIKAEEKCETATVQEAAQGPAHHTKASNTSARTKRGKGGVERGRGHRSRGTNRGRVPLRGHGGSASGNGGDGTNSGTSSTPAATPFPMDFSFSEPSVKT